VALDSEPLSEAFELIGAPVVRLHLASDQRTANLAVRVSDVFPDGAATLVTYGVLNLAHRGGSAEPQALVPGAFEEIALALNDVAYRFAPGHRIRVAISNAFWPTTWPAARVANLRVDTRESWVDLPLLAPEAELPLRRSFDPPFDGLATGVRYESDRGRTRILKEDPTTRTFTVEVLRADSRYRVLETGTEVHQRGGESYEVRADDPLSAETRIWGEWSLQGDGWRTRTETKLRVQATETAFNLSASIDAFDGDALFLRRDFAATIPRLLV
jgi:hypothetical protein